MNFKEPKSTRNLQIVDLQYYRGKHCKTPRATALIQTAAATFIAFCNQNKISPRLSFQHQDILIIHFEIVIQNNSNKGRQPKFTFSHFTRDPNLHMNKFTWDPNLHITEFTRDPNLHDIKFTRNPNLHKKFTQHQICTGPNLHKNQIYTNPILHKSHIYT